MLAMTNDVNLLGQRQRFNPDFVIGLIVAGKSKAFYYRDVAAEVVVNDKLDQFPIMVWAANDNFHAYLRQVGEQTLTFHADGYILTDEETGSTWDVINGLATDGPMKGQNLQKKPVKPTRFSGGI